MSLREECHCGHHKDTHYHDENGGGDCLGMLCNCQGYQDASKPLPPKPIPRPPKTDPLLDDFDDPSVDTPRIPTVWPTVWPMKFP